MPSQMQQKMQAPQVLGMFFSSLGLLDLPVLSLPCALFHRFSWDMPGSSGRVFSLLDKQWSGKRPRTPVGFVTWAL